jgi:hypothetical protein
MSCALVHYVQAYSTRPIVLVQNVLLFFIVIRTGPEHHVWLNNEPSVVGELVSVVSKAG